MSRIFSIRVVHMKKMLIIPAVFFLVIAAGAENRLFISLGAGYLHPNDTGYRQIYGNNTLSFEVAGAVRLYRGFCLTSSVGRFSSDATTPDLGLETKASQSYFSFGLGYFVRATELLCFEAEAGVAGINFREEALGIETKGREPGLKVGAGIMIMTEDEAMFLGLRLGYMGARLDNPYPGVTQPQTIRLGGFLVALCVGLQLFSNK